MTDFRQIFDNGTNGGEWSIWSNMVSQMEIRINDKKLNFKFIVNENQSNRKPNLSLKTIEECGKVALKRH